MKIIIKLVKFNYLGVPNLLNCIVWPPDNLINFKMDKISGTVLIAYKRRFKRFKVSYG